MKLIELMEEDEIRDQITRQVEMSYIIHNDDEADETLAQMLWAKRKIEENKALVKKKAEMLKAQLQDYERRLNGGLEVYLENRQHDLEAYLNSRLEGNKGSLKLFHGTASLKEDVGRTEVDDEEGLIKWLKQGGHADCVSVKESVSKTNLKKAFKKDRSGQYFVDEHGDVIQGVHVEKEAGLQLKISAPRTRAAQEVEKGAA